MKTEHPIESEQITIDTFTVTIRAIQVNKKQMTQAVFRQLQTGIEDNTCALWGIVKYSQIATHQGLWLVFSKNEKLFRRELELSQRRIDRSYLAQLKRDLERHSGSYCYSHMDASDYWEKQSQTYSSEHIQEERMRHEKRKHEHAHKTKALQKSIEEEELEIFNTEREEVNRYSYENGLMMKLHQLFIAV